MKSSLFVRVVFLVLYLLAGGAVSFVAAQDTRGSLVPDAKVTLADGSTVEAQDLRVGTLLWAWLPTGKPGTAKVTGIRRQHTDSFILLKVGTKEFRATGSHRVASAGGKLVRFDTIKVGDKVWVEGAKGPVEAPVTSLRLYPSNMVAYDLTVEQDRLFLADGVVVGD